MIPDPTFWWHSLGWIGGEIAAIALLASLGQLLVRSPAGRKTIWRAALVVTLLAFATEATGLVPAAGQWLKRQLPQPPVPSRKVTVQVATSPVVFDINEKLPMPVSAARIPAKKQSAIWWPAWVWLGGIGLIVVYRVMAGVLFLRLKRRMQPATDPELIERVHKLAMRLALTKQVRLFATSQVAGPFTFGLWPPAIGLPDGFTRDFTAAQQDAILAHELGHIVGRDFLWQRIGGALLALLWWHPAAWWMLRQLAIASEQAADEASLLVDNGPDALAESLVILGRKMSHSLQPILLGVEGAGFRSALAIRVHRLWAMREQQFSRAGRRYLMMAIAGGVLSLGSMAVVATVVPRHGATGTPWQHSLIGIVAEALAKPEPSPEAAPRPSTRAGLAMRSLDNLNQDLERVKQRIVEARAIYTEQHPVLLALNKKQNELSEAIAAAEPAPRPVEPQPEANALFTRVFKVDPATIQGNLKNVQVLSGRGKPMSQTNVIMLDEMLGSLGVKIEPPKTWYFNQRNGMLMVRATKQDLDTIEKALQLLNQAPPQLTIEARFCEVATEVGKVPDFEKLVGIPLTNALPASNPILAADTNAAAATLTGILTAAQYKEVFRRLEKQKGVDLLTVPRVTTLSGRPAQIKVVDIKYVVTDLMPNPSTNNANTKKNKGEDDSDLVPVTQPFELGPVIDVVPWVVADGTTIQMTVIPTIREFLGYDDQWGNRSPTVQIQPIPQPRFRQRQVVCSAAVRDGQTLVLAGGSFVEEVKTKQGMERRPAKDKQAKSLLIFVTPTLIDPAGNRVHSEPASEPVLTTPGR